MCPLIVRSTPSFELIPSGVHLAVCTGVFDLGTQHNAKFNTDGRKVLLTWEIPECRGKFERDGTMQELPLQISRTYTLTLNEKGNLHRDLTAWRGKPFTEQERSSFDLFNVLGAPCQLQIVHNESAEGRTYANVSAVMALLGGTTPPRPENPLLRFSFDEDNPQIDVGTPEWVSALITASPEWPVLTNTSGEPARLAEPSGDSAREEDDDVPF